MGETSVIPAHDLDAEIRALTPQDAWRIVSAAWRGRRRNPEAWKLVANNLTLVLHLLDRLHFVGKGGEEGA